MRNAAVTMAIAFVILGATVTSAQQGPGGGRRFGGGFGPGHGPGPGMGRGRGPMRGGMHGHDERHDEDHAVFEFLLQNHSKIKRTVKHLPDGVETLTESDDPKVAAKIKEHVEWMQYRVEKTHPIRMRDPLFAELFRNTDKITMEHVDTEKGIRVKETSQDPKVAKLIQAHAAVVSKFVERGFAEAMKNHSVPGDGAGASAKPSHPVIAGHGAVIQLSGAAQQPRAGSKLLVDITRGGDPTELNAAIEKVAKYVNIYAGAGAEPADASFALVFHGDATLAVLNPDAYKKAFAGAENPNTKLLRSLHEAGVEMYVCGQTLASKGNSSDDVLVFVDTAVSALTAVVNLQADGYAYVPLGK